MHLRSYDLIYLLLVPALIKAAVELLKRLLVRTEEDAIKWLHYKLRAMRLGHILKHPHSCLDGLCEHIKP